jgi:hypothetical protein
MMNEYSGLAWLVRRRYACDMQHTSNNKDYKSRLIKKYELAFYVAMVLGRGIHTFLYTYW